MNKEYRVVFTIPYGSEKMKEVEALGYNLSFIPESKLAQQTVPGDTDILVCYDPFAEIGISSLRQLKWIQLVSKGINQVPFDEVERNQIIVTNNGNATAVPVSEWIVSMLLFIFKNSAGIHRRKDQKRWEIDKDILELYGKNICIIGTGNIARETAARLKPFGAVLCGINSDGRDIRGFDRCLPLDRLKEILPDCDAVISCLPDTADTRHLLDDDTFSLMKRGVALINISRGSVINEEALAEYLEKGLFRGVALDVFETEPLQMDSPLWGFANVIITPHNSFLSDAYRQRVFSIIYENLRRFRNGDPLLNTVDFKKGY